MGQDERQKVEFFGGYSYLNTDTGFDSDLSDGKGTGSGSSGSINDRFGSHGFGASLTGNFRRYVGAKFDFSTHSKTQTYSDFYPEGGYSEYRLKFKTNLFLGGLQFKDNNKEGGRVRPFAHVLAGIANQKATFSGLDAVEGMSYSESLSKNSFAMALGGGLDVRAGKRVSVRVFQFDFVPVFFKADDDLDLSSHTQKNFRISAGIVIH